MLLVDADGVGRCSGIDLDMLIERVAVDLAEIARFADPQDHRFYEAVETAEQLLRGNFGEIPWTDGALDRFEHRIFTDAGRSTEHDHMINLLSRALHP